MLNYNTLIPLPLIIIDYFNLLFTIVINFIQSYFQKQNKKRIKEEDEEINRQIFSIRNKVLVRNDLVNKASGSLYIKNNNNNNNFRSCITTIK